MWELNCFLIFSVIFKVNAIELENIDKCNTVISDNLKKEIAGYSNVINKVIEYVTHGELKGRTYNELAEFVDTFGPRLSGSDQLEKSINYMINLSKSENLDNIATEKVDVPHWVRGHEYIQMYKPKKRNITVLGLGKSVSTSKFGILAEVVVVANYSELSKSNVKGKIVLYNAPFTKYSDTADYRTNGAIAAARYGAVAVLVRSITPFSLHSPHTGSVNYHDNVTKIPAAAITIEDAEYMKRAVDRGLKVVLKMELFSSMDTKNSRNTIIDLKGRESDDLVIVSGHIDSWDVGQGAMDDGGGMFVSWMVPVVLKHLNLQPKRTIRTIFWTAEEVGLVGAHAYEAKHNKELHQINFIMESDEGTFNPRGLVVSGTQEAKCIVKEILKLFEPLNATTLIENDAAGSDISVIIKKGVPGASLYNGNDDDKYFWFHHTEADTMTVEDPGELDRCTAFWAGIAYVIADLSINIPR